MQMECQFGSDGLLRKSEVFKFVFWGKVIDWITCMVSK